MKKLGQRKIFCDCFTNGKCEAPNYQVQVIEKFDGSGKIQDGAMVAAKSK